MEEREVVRIGGDQVISVNVRVIAASNRILSDMVEDGTFREDLYYRIKVLPLNIPPLRERRSEIIEIAEYYKVKMGSRFQFSQASKERMLQYKWPGNIRELKNCMEFLDNLDIETIEPEDMPFSESDLKIGDDINQPQANEEIFILKKLVESKSKFERMGRRSLWKAAREYGLMISEQRIRLMLLEMEKQGYVIVHKGIVGTVITPNGVSYLNNLKL